MTPLQNLCENGVDVLILGGGINGAGLFRDLCEQGVRCAIIEKNDFGSGTSAAPSRLIHGGLKYLETGEFRLVAQSTLERNLLLRNAPHCVEPLLTMIPIFSWTKGSWAALRTLFGSTTAPRSRGALLLKIGLSIYDYYGARRNVMPRHRLFGRKRALRDMPQLTPRVVAAATYYDAKISRPERLIWELVADGLAANPASLALNHTELSAQDGDALTFTHQGDSFTLRPRIVINAAGPWIDRVNAALGTPTTLIGGTKGSHILLNHPDLLRALNGQMIYFEADDGRILLVYDHLGKAMVGSTDIKAADPDTVRCDDDEIAYFLTSLRALLPGFSFDHSQIAYVYSGIRPLPASDAANPGLISRDHSTPTIEATLQRPYPIIALVGGKWTTFRGFADEVADTCLHRLGMVRLVSTQGLGIGGGKGYPADPAPYLAQAGVQTGLPPDRVKTIFIRYGTAMMALFAHIGAWTDADRLPDSHATSLAEIDWITRTQSVITLADLVQRRTSLAMEGRLTTADLRAIAEVVAVAGGWDTDRKEREINVLTESLRDLNRMVL